MFIVLRKLRETCNVGDSRKLKVGFRETFSCCKGYTRLVLIFNLIGQFVSLARRLGFTSHHFVKATKSQSVFPLEYFSAFAAGTFSEYIAFSLPSFHFAICT